MSLNQAVFNAVYSLTGNPILDGLMYFLAESLILFIPLTLLYLWFSEGRDDALFTAYSTFISILLTYVMGLFYTHENPSATFETVIAYHPENSFPSQHTAAMFGAAFPLLYRERKRLGWLITVSGILTGFSRVYIGEHWPVDILGSVFAAGLGLAVAYLSWDMLEPVRRPLLELYERIEEDFLEKLESLRS